MGEGWLCLCVSLYANLMYTKIRIDRNVNLHETYMNEWSMNLAFTRDADM